MRVNSRITLVHNVLIDGLVDELYILYTTRAKISRCFLVYIVKTTKS